MKRIVFYSGKEDTMKEKVTVTGVPETMIQTLYARAKESQKPDAKIKDTMAVEIVSELDYDFSNADKDKAMGSGVMPERSCLTEWWENIWTAILRRLL